MKILKKRNRKNFVLDEVFLYDRELTLIRKDDVEDNAVRILFK